MRYDISRVIAHGRERVCCASADFLKEGQSIITLAHLLKREVGESMKQQLGKLPSDKARIRYIAEQTAEITGLHDFPQYLTLLFEIDSLILNDDRQITLQFWSRAARTITALFSIMGQDFCQIGRCIMWG